MPIENIDGTADDDTIVKILRRYGIEQHGEVVSVEIWGSGKPMCEFLWSEDMADACTFILENRDFEDTYSKESKEIRNTHINIGTGSDMSIKDLAL